MSVHHICVYSDQGPKEGMGSTETRVPDGHVGAGGTDLGPLSRLSSSLFILLKPGFILALTGSLTSILPSPHCVDRPCLCPFSLSPAFSISRTLDFTV